MIAELGSEGAPRFADRREAGRLLAEGLAGLLRGGDAIVLALPRGGVPVGYEVAVALGAPLDAFVVRKLGVPGHRELAMGAIASGGIRVVDERLVSGLGVDRDAVGAVIAEEEHELERAERRYREGRPAPELEGRSVALVDDGLATGSSMRAAVRAVRARAPASTTVAVPVAPRDTCEALGDEAEEVHCLATPDPFHAVGSWYEDFTQTTDEEVRELLDRADREHGSAPVSRHAPSD